MDRITSLVGKATLSVLSASLLFAALSPSASAFNLVPQQEGEINAKVGASLDSKGYLSTSGFKVESLAFDVSRGGKTFSTQSRLFVDKAGTANTYNSGIKFISRDIGTSEENQAFWLRPVAMITEKGSLLEAGQLEAGKFRFTFDKPLSLLSLNFFDVESKGTAIVAVNGNSINTAVASGSNNSIKTVDLSNVTSFDVVIGNPNTSGANRNDPGWGTGDGVLLKGVGEVAKTVPEPGTIAGLAVVGGFTISRRKRKS